MNPGQQGRKATLSLAMTDYELFPENRTHKKACIIAQGLYEDM